MNPDIYWVAQSDGGRLGVMARPRGGDWLAGEMSAVRAAGTDALLSLLTAEEADELDLEQEPQLSKQHQMEYLTYPIADRDVPPSTKSFVDLLERIAELLRQRKTVVVHCRMGVGRSAMVAAGLLCLEGLNPGEAFARVEASRRQHVPDTPAQRQWVERAVESQPFVMAKARRKAVVPVP